MTTPESVYQQKKEAAARQMVAQSGQRGGGIALRKRTSNLFRAVDPAAGVRLDLGGFDRVLRIDPESLEADVEARITFEALVGETLRHGLLPAVVPQLKSITLGGAISGGGIESSSFRHGFVHETVREMDVLLSSGQIVTCNPRNEHRDLFFGVPNSYATLGYVLRARIALVKAGPFVKLGHRRFHSPPDCLAAVEKISRGEGEADGAPDFVDGAVFSERELYLTVGRFVDEAPQVSDYRYMQIYYRSIRSRPVDYLRTADYIWRWDTDWFWCSRAFGMEKRPIRFLFGALGLLRSTTYWKMRHLAWKTGLLAALARNSPREEVIQDVEIPVDRAAEFLEFFQREIGILPVWLCPTKSPDPAADFVLYQTDPHRVYVNFGFWASRPSDKPAGHYNRLIEKKVVELGGKKSLYSASYFPEGEFWRVYNRAAYDRLKRKYDPGGRFRDLYRKCVLDGKG